MQVSERTKLGRVVQRMAFQLEPFALMNRDLGPEVFDAQADRLAEEPVRRVAEQAYPGARPARDQPVPAGEVLGGRVVLH